MGGVEDVGVAEHDQRGRVRRLGDEHPARAQPGDGEVDEAQQHVELQVLDHMRADDRTERALVEAFEMGDHVAEPHVETGRLTLGDQTGVEIDPVRVDIVFGELGHELTATATDVEHGRRRREDLEVPRLEDLEHDRGVAAEPLFESGVVEQIRCDVGCVSVARPARAAGRSAGGAAAPTSVRNRRSSP